MAKKRAPCSFGSEAEKIDLGVTRPIQAVSSERLLRNRNSCGKPSFSVLSCRKEASTSTALAPRSVSFRGNPPVPSKSHRGIAIVVGHLNLDVTLEVR